MEDKLTARQWAWFAAIVLSIGGLIFIGLAAMNADKKEPFQKQEQAYVELVEAELRDYYANERIYPISESDLSEIFDDEEGLSYRDVTKELEDFNYTVRGDREAYKFTYTDNDGKSQTVSGNYKEDYN